MRAFLTASLILMPTYLLAETPKVVTSIQPVSDLVATIMRGVGEPTPLLERNQSPHHASMRPSRMRALAEADLIIWVGENMEPWLEKGLEVANPSAIRLELSLLEGVNLLEVRQPATLASEEEQALAAQETPEGLIPEEQDSFFAETDEFLESDLEAEANELAEAQEQALLTGIVEDEDHAEPAEAEEHDHEGGFHDPHVWLDPANSALFIGEIAHILADLDPDHAEIYLGNAEAAQLELAEAVLDSKDRLSILGDTRFIFNHDTFQYFEKAFGLKSLGSLTTTHSQAIGAKSIAKIEAKVEFAPTLCVVIDSSESARSVTALFPNAETINLSPLGFGLTDDGHYPSTLFRALTDGFAECG